MNKTNDTNTRLDSQDGVIMLGVASVETKGVAGTGEPEGREMGVGIADE